MLSGSARIFVWLGAEPLEQTFQQRLLRHDRICFSASVSIPQNKNVDGLSTKLHLKWSAKRVGLLWLVSLSERLRPHAACIAYIRWEFSCFL